MKTHVFTSVTFKLKKGYKNKRKGQGNLHYQTKTSKKHRRKEGRKVTVTVSCCSVSVFSLFWLIPPHSERRKECYFFLWRTRLRRRKGEIRKEDKKCRELYRVGVGDAEGGGVHHKGRRHSQVKAKTQLGQWLRQWW